MAAPTSSSTEPLPRICTVDIAARPSLRCRRRRVRAERTEGLAAPCIVGTGQAAPGGSSRPRARPRHGVHQSHIELAGDRYAAAPHLPVAQTPPEPLRASQSLPETATACPSLRLLSLPAPGPRPPCIHPTLLTGPSLQPATSPSMPPAMPAVPAARCRESCLRASSKSCSTAVPSATSLRAYAESLQYVAHMLVPAATASR